MIKETSNAATIAQSACVQEGRNHRRKGFSLVELLVAMAVLALVILLTANIVNYARSVWVSTMGMTTSFREGRAAFETMSRRVSQATLNSYVDYLDSSGQSRNIVGDSFVPNRFARESELHFVIGQARDLLSGVGTIPSGAELPGHAIFFQAPLGFTEAAPTGDAQPPNLLNAAGYFVQYSDDQEWMPKFLRSTLSAKKRYRLMQVVQGSEKLRIYNTPLNAGNRFSWFRDRVGDEISPVLVVAPFAIDPAHQKNGGCPTINRTLDGLCIVLVIVRRAAELLRRGPELLRIPWDGRRILDRQI